MLTIYSATGVSLSYLSAKELIDLKVNFINWEDLAWLILKKGLKSADCLCHGMIGNVEAVISISNSLNNDNLKEVAQKYVYSEMLLHSESLKWHTGFTNRDYSLSGLMLGNAGIGYGLIKTFWGDKVPSILMLEPPHQNSKISSQEDNFHEVSKS